MSFGDYAWSYKYNFYEWVNSEVHPSNRGSAVHSVQALISLKGFSIETSQLLFVLVVKTEIDELF